jgi:GTP-binding protein
VRTDDGFEMVLADIPGLIEGASEGKGLGHQFLRHVERARALLVLLDLAPYDGVSPEEQERVLLQELGNYRPDLLDRPRIVMGSRADMAPDSDFEGDTVSSMTGAGIPPLIGALVQMVGAARQEEPEVETTTVHHPVSSEIELTRHDDGSWEVLGRSARRAISLSDLTNEEALEYAQMRLQQIGVNTTLARAGVKQGEIVHIGDFAFEYQED